jgi:PleD family two-component response regulator
MKVYTTGQVAKICKMSPTTVKRRFNEGRLKGYRDPVNRYRIIPLEYLFRFMQERGIPLDALEDDVFAKVLIVSHDQALIDNLLQTMTQENGFRAISATDHNVAGEQASTFRPDAVVVDSAMMHHATTSTIQLVRPNTTLVIVLVPQEGCSFKLPNITAGLRKPIDAISFSQRLKTFIGAKKELL